MNIVTKFYKENYVGYWTSCIVLFVLGLFVMQKMGDLSINGALLLVPYSMSTLFIGGFSVYVLLDGGNR